MRPISVQGWEGDYERFVRSHLDGLQRTGFLLTAGDQHLAEDLVQTALFATYQSWSKIRDTEAVGAFARRALINAHHDHFRRRRHHERPTEQLPDRSVDAVSDELDSRLMVLAALRRLSPGQRAAVVLRYYDDLTEAQTAKVLGCALGTVKSRVHQALSHLRAMPEFLFMIEGRPSDAAQ